MDFIINCSWDPVFKTLCHLTAQERKLHKLRISGLGHILPPPPQLPPSLYLTPSPNKLSQNLKLLSQQNAISHSQYKCGVLLLTIRNLGMKVLPSCSCTTWRISKGTSEGEEEDTQGTLIRNDVSLLLTFLFARAHSQGPN